MISVHRHSQLMKTFQETQNLSESARQAGIDRKTARDYIETGRPPGKPKAPRNWKTRADPFEEVWPEIQALLLQNPRIQATSLFGDLQTRYPGKFPDGQLRTLQRKVGQWREANQATANQEIYFEQVHVPGRMLQLDWFHPKIYEVTIRGVAFKHQICHSVLTYSNWEHATICQSESLLSLQTALQDTLWALGGVPSILQTDNSSTATHAVSGKGKKREFNTRYLSILNHFSIQAQTINVRKAHENGDVESSHQHYRKAIADALTLRGSHDFESLQAFQSWLDDLSTKRNLNRQAKFAQERFAPAPPASSSVARFSEVVLPG